MPKKFDQCVRNGGKVRTIKPTPTTYIHICKAPGSKKTVSGYVKHNKKSTKRR